jgi:uncharacterized protein
MSLHNAARENKLEEVKVLIAQGGNVNDMDNMRRTPLILAAWKGNTDIIRILLSANADSNVRAMDQFTALHFAAQAGHVDSVKLLAKKNKSLLNARISKGQKSALHLAASKGHLEVVKALIALGADVHGKTSHGQTAADLAGDPEIKRFLTASSSSEVRADEEDLEISEDNNVTDEMMSSAVEVEPTKRSLKEADDDLADVKRQKLDDSSTS